MSFLVCHVMKFRQVDLRGVSIHNNRESSNSSNKDIDYSRTELNFDAITGEDGNPHTNYRAEVEKRLDANYKGERAIRSDAVRLVSVLVSSDHDFFANMDRQETARFFRTAAEYLSERYGAENVVAAKVHMDETTPHMHFTFVPLTNDGRLSAKEITSRSKLRSLQDELPKVMQRAGFDVQRGIENSPNKHVSKQQFSRELAINAAEQEKQEPVVEKPAVKIPVSEAFELVDKYIKTLNKEDDMARKKADYIGKLIPSDNKIILEAQSVFTNGESKTVTAEHQKIKSEEKQYTEAYENWQKTKPTGITAFLSNKGKEDDFKSWKADIESKKTANQTKINALKEKLNTAEGKSAVRVYREVLEEQTAYLKKRQQSYLDSRKELNSRIQACHPIRNKLRDEMYTTSTITISGETYENLKVGNTEKAKDIISELHHKTDELRKIKLQNLAKMRSRGRSNDGWER